MMTTTVSIGASDAARSRMLPPGSRTASASGAKRPSTPAAPSAAVVRKKSRRSSIGPSSRGAGSRNPAFTRKAGDLSLAYDDVDVPFPRHDLDGRAESPAVHAQVDAGLADTQVPDVEAFEPRGKHGAAQRQGALPRLDPESQSRLEQEQHAPCRPGLRPARHGIRYGLSLSSAREAAEQLGEATVLDRSAGVEQRAQHLRCVTGGAVASEPGRDERIVVRPHRAVVVAHGIEGGGPLGGGPVG